MTTQLQESYSEGDDHDEVFSKSDLETMGETSDSEEEPIFTRLQDAGDEPCTVWIWEWIKVEAYRFV